MSCNGAWKARAPKLNGVACSDQSSPLYEPRSIDEGRQLFLLCYALYGERFLSPELLRCISYEAQPQLLLCIRLSGEAVESQWYLLDRQPPIMLVMAPSMQKKPSAFAFPSPPVHSADSREPGLESSTNVPFARYSTRSVPLSREASDMAQLVLSLIQNVTSAIPLIRSDASGYWCTYTSLLCDYPSEAVPGEHLSFGGCAGKYLRFSFVRARQSTGVTSDVAQWQHPYVQIKT
ncbi:uncharacterized protein F5147DRAFT_763118 [Suillus discolor]|uniref:Uncharacterized protein n=1 Tax=Suillus discolor TaxID=1912936 RepID=A0A9P7F0S8_9AGAM|nr:uncharacterized protein F5147DRAFT_763118 [Suillus discolor]KAG2098911.1 hypothetical protein F5147DRAFT_763118 [Suillus discolor]